MNEGQQRNMESQDAIERERWLRRQAMQIVVQLPEEDAEAIAVLDYARGLVRPG